MQVLLNLQSNALKFTEKGCVRIGVNTINKGEEEFLQVSVSDTGCGIKKEDQKKLF
jgi:signal transduction histidine kinase